MASNVAILIIGLISLSIANEIASDNYAAEIDFAENYYQEIGCKKSCENPLA